MSPQCFLNSAGEVPDENSEGIIFVEFMYCDDLNLVTNVCSSLVACGKDLCIYQNISVYQKN